MAKYPYPFKQGNVYPYPIRIRENCGYPQNIYPRISAKHWLEPTCSGRRNSCITHDYRRRLYTLWSLVNEYCSVSVFTLPPPPRLLQLSPPASLSRRFGLLRSGTDTSYDVESKFSTIRLLKTIESTFGKYKNMQRFSCTNYF